MSACFVNKQKKRSNTEHLWLPREISLHLVSDTRSSQRREIKELKHTAHTHARTHANTQHTHTQENAPVSPYTDTHTYTNRDSHRRTHTKTHAHTNTHTHRKIHL